MPRGQCARCAIVEVKQLRLGIGWVTKYYLEFPRASKSTVSVWSQLHLLSLAPINPYWAFVVGFLLMYSP
jgi:hypothetical protein